MYNVTTFWKLHKIKNIIIIALGAYKLNVEAQIQAKAYNYYFFY